MAVKRPYGIPESKEAIGVVVDEFGNESNRVLLTRTWYRLISQFEKLTGTGGALAGTEDLSVKNAFDIVVLRDDVDQLRLELDQLRSDFDDHESLTTAHGSNGDIIGKDDLASIGFAGLVKKGVDPTDSAGATLAQLTADYNTLLQNLRNSGVL